DLWLTDAADLSLKVAGGRTSGLREFRLLDNAFQTLPRLLYERKYATVDILWIAINSTPMNYILPLNAEEFTNAKTNLANFTKA
ncbi:hypothetical protein PINS_up011419, partial [Pythium insidiosum]